jgi:hypothetical protein
MAADTAGAADVADGAGGTAAAIVDAAVVGAASHGGTGVDGDTDRAAWLEAVDGDTEIKQMARSPMATVAGSSTSSRLAPITTTTTILTIIITTKSSHILPELRVLRGGGGCGESG